MIALLILLVVIFLIIFLIHKIIKNQVKKRIITIDECYNKWIKLYNDENFQIPELPHDKYLNVSNSQNKYTRMKSCEFYIESFYNKDFNSKLYLQKLIKIFGIEKGNEYFNNGFELGLNKNDIISVLGSPKDSKKEILKTKNKETLYYSHIKSDNFYVFDNDILVKIVL